MKKLLPLLMVLLLLCACRREQNAVPKRYAYPRIEAYDTLYTRVAVGGASFEINAGADTVAPRPGWLDVAYQKYGVTLHLSVNSFSSDADLDAAIRNRYQRVSLNFDGSKANTETFDNGHGFKCEIISAPEAGSAPILFVAASTEGHLVSGAAVFAGNTQPVDSIYPIFDALYADVARLLLSLE